MRWIPTKTLIAKELKRSFRVPIQVFGTPVITAVLFFLVFGYSVGSRIGPVQGVEYDEFIMPGLLMMNVVLTTFSSVASALMLAKVMNVLSDIFLSPMTHLEILLGFTVSAVLRGVLTALLIWLVALFFIPATIIHPLYLITFLLIVSFLFSILGLIAGIWADNFEQMNLFPAFLITPLTFLGGVFYSIEMLPPLFQTISKYNPFLYLINGMRYGFYGVSDVNPTLSYIVVLVLLFAVGWFGWYLLKIGYKVRS